jgi:hypothetical protein
MVAKETGDDILADISRPRQQFLENNSLLIGIHIGYFYIYAFIWTDKTWRLIMSMLQDKLRINEAVVVTLPIWQGKCQFWYG